MPSTLPSSFASAAAGQNPSRDTRSGARNDGRGNTSGDWSRTGRSANGGTLTFRRTSATPSNQSLHQLQAAESAQSASADPAIISAMPMGATNVDSLGAPRYTRDELLSLHAAYDNNPQQQPDVSALFVQGWNPGHSNGNAPRGWGKTNDSHVAPQEPDICWDTPGSTKAVGLREMNPEEKELFSSDVNSTMKPPVQNKDGNHPGGGVNGRKTSLSHGTSNNFGLVSPSAASRPGTRRRETTDTNPYSGGGGLVSPSSATRPSRDDAPYWLGRKNTDLKDLTFEEPEEDAGAHETSRTLPFGGMMRNNTTPGGPGFGSVSPWQTSAAGTLPGIGSFGNFALPGSSIGDKRPGNQRGESRLAHLIPKDSSDNITVKSNEDTNRSWRPRQRTDTDPFGEDSVSGSAVLGGAQDTSPAPMSHPPLHTSFDTPVKGSTGDFGMASLNLGHLDEQTPLSPSETNPYRSPPGERGEHEDASDRQHGSAGVSDRVSGYVGTLPRSFNQAGFDGSDRSQTSSVGGKAYPPLSNLTGWPSSGTPDRERGPFPSFGGSLFSSVGELQSPSLGNLGGVFGPASAGGFSGGTGSFGRASKLGSLFPPAMQAQMQSQDTENLNDSVPDLRQPNPLGAIGRGAPGDHARETGSPMRAGRGIFAEMFAQSDSNRTPISSEPLHGGISAAPQGQAFTGTSNTPFSASQSSEPPSVQSRTMVMPDRMRWVYLDPQGHQQGPFTGLEMNDWYKANFFTPDLRVKKLEDSEFEPLGQLIRRIGNSREPFLVPQIGIPHGPPSQTGPFSNSGGVIQPPLVNAFPSFGRTLTAEEQNNLERRKQEEQYLMARHRDYYASQQPMSRVPLGGVPGLHHHSSAHSLQSQPSFGSITSPIAMPPLPPIGAIGTSSSFFDGPATHQAAVQGSSAQGLGMLREDELATLSGPERQMLAGIHRTGAAGGSLPPQPIGAPTSETGGRSQLPGSGELADDAEGFRGRLQEFEKLRAQHEAELLARQSSPLHETTNDQAMTQASPSAQVTEPDAAMGESPESVPNRRQEAEQSASLTKQYQQAQAAAAAAKISGLPLPFPPPPSATPLPAPAPQRVRSNLPEQYATSSRSGTPDVTPSSAAAQPPPLAPWAKDSGVESHKGPSLKEIQQAEALKAAREEEAAALARRAALEQEAAREREKVAAAAPGLPTSSTWGTASPVNPGISSPWAKPGPAKATASTSVAQAQNNDKKKTLADIQREEELRKQKTKEVTVQTGPVPNAGKRYADLASKPNAAPVSAQAPSATTSGWATVGAGGKVKTPAGAPTQTRPASSASAKPSPAVAPPSRPTVKAATTTSTAGSGHNEAMNEFTKWLHSQLAKGITGVTDIDAFANTLIGFPLVGEIISDAIYANSKTMDGRHFAEEFIRRKKLADKGIVEKQPAKSPSADTQSSMAGGWNEVAKKTSHKESSNDASSMQGAGFKVVPGLNPCCPCPDRSIPSITSSRFICRVDMATDQFSPATLISIEKSFDNSNFLSEFQTQSSKHLVIQFVQHLAVDGSDDSTHKIRLGLASLGAFLQANVTGPVLEGAEASEAIFTSALAEVNPEEPGGGKGVNSTPVSSLRRLCLRSLDVDGVSPYPYIPYIELFCLSRFIFTSGVVLPTELPEIWSDPRQSLSLHLSWIRLRIHLWHYKLITQPSLGPGSLYTKSGRWTDVPTLQELIERSFLEAETSVSGPVEGNEGSKESQWPQESRIQFHLEEATCHILLGNDAKARTALQLATKLSNFSYALSGALGKRTRFQENNISQLVVLAKSLALSEDSQQHPSNSAPVALPLNDDTLLEKIEFDNDKTEVATPSVPPQLQDLTPEDQPQLHPEDQIILLTEATLRDTFSPADSLTAEEILPFAVRVIDDKSTNWQIYTQALLVRSRIELNRSRTLERAVLQMQALVDQIIVDTQASTGSTEKSSDGQDEAGAGPKIPSIQMTSEDQSDHSTHVQKPTSFLPAPKPAESASPQERLRYANALSSPPRWHLESELAYAWTAVGSLVSALEIFKRLRLWPEVALCLASAAGADDQDGRGSGGEDKARAVVRWRLFHRSGTSSNGTTAEGDSDSDDLDTDVSTLKASDFGGPERSPPPPNAPRLFCILGDIENDPQHYQRAWEISNRRFARAQRSLGELHLRRQEWKEARDAYKLAVSVNRLSPEMWNRLGDIELRLGNFADAAEAFQRAISTANNTSGGDNARTWSNMGTALLSWYRQIIQEEKDQQDKLKNDDDEPDTLGAMTNTKRAAELGKPAHQLLQDALVAFKRGATLADSNWRIWDNVVTLAASLSPGPDLDDVVLGLRNVIRIRKAEDALDVDVLALLVREATKTPAPETASVYEPARGSVESKIVTLFETDVVPLITTNSSCWALVSRLRAWRRDWAGALDAAEKAWRTAIGGAGVGSALSASSGHGNWLVDADAWDAVVQRTAELVAAYENYGARVDAAGARWKGKARSAVRSVMGKAKEAWEGDERWRTLTDMMDDLR
ncbi:hypothetical protein GGR52DRAFT_579917 [Hypoxylon sp. FL1284]|nr:hypothetical protein GGR52DRAFT_579917 [Hypoxylon sp. FL1284]